MFVEIHIINIHFHNTLLVPANGRVLLFLTNGFQNSLNEYSLQISNTWKYFISFYFVGTWGLILRGDVSYKLSISALKLHSSGRFSKYFIFENNSTHWVFLRWDLLSRFLFRCYLFWGKYSINYHSIMMKIFFLMMKIFSKFKRFISYK